MLASGSLGLVGGCRLDDVIVERETSVNAVQQVGAVTRCANQFTDANKVHAGLCLGVGILDQVGLRVLLNVGHLGQLDEVIDALSLVLEVETGVLEGEGEVDDGLANVLHLLKVANHDLALSLMHKSDFVPHESSSSCHYRSVR